MPKGQYDRSGAKPRVYSEEAREHLRANMRKAQEASMNSQKASAAKSKAAEQTNSIRTAKSILKKLQAGMKRGDVIRLASRRRLTILDPVPIQGKDGKWEQKFSQSGHNRIYGHLHEFKGVCRIYWTGRPAMNDLTANAFFEEVKGE